MRKLILVLMLLLLLPLAMGVNVQADETDPPPDPGTQDGGGGDIEGDHPWGGNDNVVVVEPETEPDQTVKMTLSFSKYVQFLLFTNYNIDLFSSSPKSSNVTSVSRPVSSRSTYDRYSPNRRTR